MGFKKEAPMVEVPMETGPTKEPTAPPAETRKYAGDESRVRGQVRMHAIVCGYKVASALAPTLANTAASIKDELHKLAAEVAMKIEAYSFSEE